MRRRTLRIVIRNPKPCTDNLKSAPCSTTRSTSFAALPMPSSLPDRLQVLQWMHPNSVKAVNDFVADQLARHAHEVTRRSSPASRRAAEPPWGWRGRARDTAVGMAGEGRRSSVLEP